MSLTTTLILAGVFLVLALVPPAAATAREIVKFVGDVRVRVILMEAGFGRMFTESDFVRNHPEVCPICERMALTGDSLLWIPVGIRWERPGGLLIDPVIELHVGGRVYRSKESWVGRPTRNGLVTVRTPVRIPPGWECEPQYANWKGVSLYVAFPRSIHPPGGGWPLALHPEDVEDAEVRVN